MRNERYEPIQQQTEALDFKQVQKGLPKKAILFASAAVSVGLLGYAYHGENGTGEEGDLNGVSFAGSVSDAPELGAFQEANGEEISNLANYFQETNERALNKSELKEKLVDAYSKSRISYDEHMRFKLISDPSPEKINEVRQERYESVVNGILLLKEFFGRTDIEIDTQNFTVSIPGSRSFDLSDTTDLCFLDQYIQYEMDEKAIGEEESTRSSDILWLANSGIEITVHDDAFVFPPREDFLHLSRLFQITIPMGHPTPNTEYRARTDLDHPHLAAEYVRGTNTSLISRDARSGVGVHEAGHFFSDEVGGFEQERFDEMVKNLTESISAGGNVVSSKSFLTEYSQKNGKEDYAEHFEAYFIDGVKFREELKRLYLQRSPDYDMLKAKYEFMKDIFNGMEFAGDGIVFDPKIGDVYEINDPDEIPVGVKLRAKPSLEDEEVPLEIEPIVKDGMSVHVTREPIPFWNEHMGLDSSFVYVVSSEGYAGWIDQIWLGEKIGSAEEGRVK